MIDARTSAVAGSRVSPARLLRWCTLGIFALLALNVVGALVSVIVESLSGQWFDSWLPSAWTFQYYESVWTTYDLAHTLLVTLEVAGAVVVVSLLLGLPAAYVLARKNFRGKRLVLLLFLLPIMIPPITYGIPLATVMYQTQLGGTLPGVLIANMVPGVPFVVLVLLPFVEQIDPNLEAAARMSGASTRRVFSRILLPLAGPALLAAGLLVFVRTVALFELTFLVSGPTSQTLVVSLYYSVFASGFRPPQAVATMAVIYMLSTLIVMIVALRFVSPTQVVGRSR